MRLIELVEKAKSGSEKAFMDLIENMKVQIYKTALIRLRDEHDALDAIQETFTKAFSSIKNLRDNLFFKTWLIRILINECNNIHKYKNKVIPMENNNTVFESDTEKDNSDAMDMKTMLEDLSVIYREVIDLRYNHDLKFEDIAKVLDIPVGTVKSRLNRAHGILRNRFWETNYEKEEL